MRLNRNRVRKFFIRAAKFLETCPPGQRGRPLSEKGRSALGDKNICQKRRKKDGEIIYYRSSGARESARKKKEELERRRARGEKVRGRRPKSLADIKAVAKKKGGPPKGKKPSKPAKPSKPEKPLESPGPSKPAKPSKPEKPLESPGPSKLAELASAYELLEAKYEKLEARHKKLKKEFYRLRKMIDNPPSREGGQKAPPREKDAPPYKSFVSKAREVSEELMRAERETSVRIWQVRERMPQWPRELFDQYLRKLTKDGYAYFIDHNNPRELSSKEKQGSIQDIDLGSLFYLVWR